MILKKRCHHDCIVLDVERSVTGSDGYRLNRAFEELLDRSGEATHFVLNLSRATSFDSFGMAALVSIFLSASEHPSDPKVTLVNPNPTLARMFEVAHLDQLFGQFADENAARRWASLLTVRSRGESDGNVLCGALAC